MPTIWLFILYFFIKSKYWKIFLLLTCFIFLFVPSVPIVTKFLSSFFYENQYKVSNKIKKPVYILVLGAGAVNSGANSIGSYLTPESLERGAKGVEMAKIFSVPLIFSGGQDALFLSRKYSDSEDINIITEIESNSTYSSAKNLKKIINPSDGPILLVTSRLHNKRAILSLKKQKFDVMIPNSYKGKIGSYSILPSFGAIVSFNKVLYETLGIAWYYVTGKI
jgi:uncharacterized SAM-binding protein YcdF (DUF218 family)